MRRRRAVYPLLVDTVACDSCGKQINPKFGSCPACGARRIARVEVKPIPGMDGPPRRGRPEPRTAEQERRLALAQQGILARGAEAPAPVTGAGSALGSVVSPHQNTFGWMRVADIVLGAIALPFFVASLVGVVFMGVEKWGRLTVFDLLFGGAVGTFLLYFVGMVMEWPGAVTKTVIGVGLGAWVIRGLLRGYAWWRHFHHV